MARFENVKKEVDEIMSGAIARTWADDILEQGFEQGVQQGIDQGIKKGKKEGVKKGKKKGRDETLELINFLVANGKMEEFYSILNDRAAFNKLLQKFKKGELIPN